MSLRAGSLGSNLLTCLYVVLIAMSIGKVIPLVPAIGADLRIGEVQASWLISVVTLAGVFVAPFGGVLSARFDDRAILAAACVIAAAGSVLAGLAVSFGLALAGRVVEGCALFLILNSAMTLLMRTNDGPRLSGLLALFLACVPVGIALSAAVVGQVAGTGWRGVFMGHAVLMAVALPGCLLLPRPAAAPHGEGAGGGLIAAYRRPPVWLGLMLAALSIVQLGGVSLLPAYLVRHFALPLGDAVALASSGMLVGILGNAIGGVLLGRGVSTHRIVMTALPIVALAGALTFSGMGGVAGSVAAFMVVLVAGSCALAALLALSPAVAKSPELMGQSNAVVNQINNIGMLAGPPLMFAVFAGAGETGLQVLLVLVAAAPALILQATGLGRRHAAPLPPVGTATGG